MGDISLLILLNSSSLAPPSPPGCFNSTPAPTANMTLEEDGGTGVGSEITYRYVRVRSPFQLFTFLRRASPAPSLLRRASLVSWMVVSASSTLQVYVTRHRWVGVGGVVAVLWGIPHCVLLSEVMLVRFITQFILPSPPTVRIAIVNSLFL